MAGEDRTSRLKTTIHEYVKQYMVYDGSGRMTDVYTAHANAMTGTPCTRTRYSYVSTSTRIEKRLEMDAEWNSTWDMA